MHEAMAASVRDPFPLPAGGCSLRHFDDHGRLLRRVHCAGGVPHLLQDQRGEDHLGPGPLLQWRSHR